MEREKVSFIAYKPYLTVGYVTLYNNPNLNAGLKDKTVQFDGEGRVTTDNPVALQGLRYYAERTKRQHILAELTEGLDPEEFRKLHDEAEDKLIEQAEKRQQEKQQEAETDNARKEEIYKYLTAR